MSRFSYLFFVILNIPDLTLNFSLRINKFCYHKTRGADLEMGNVAVSHFSQWLRRISNYSFDMVVQL